MKTKVRIALFLIVLLLVIALLLGFMGPQSKALKGTTGVFGTVLLGPTCSVVRINASQACADKPYRTNMLITNTDDLEIATVSSNSSGEFSYPLPPGEYNLNPMRNQNRSLFPRGRPVYFVVNESNYTNVTMLYDTGIR